MESAKSSLWRVPAAMVGSGLVARFLSVPLARLFLVRLEDGTLTNSPLYSPFMSLVRLVLFFAAGWLLLRGLTRKEIFCSATIMVIYGFAVLAVEQISQAILGTGWLHILYYLYIPTSVCSTVTSLLFRLTPDTFPHWGYVLLAVPGQFFPYLYLVFGKKRA